MGRANCSAWKSASGTAAGPSRSKARSASFPAESMFIAPMQTRWPEYDRTRATNFMRRLAGCDYGYAAVLAAAMLHLPVIRLAVRAEVKMTRSIAGHRFAARPVPWPTASAAASTPCRIWPIGLTEPADLARSPFYFYQFTLVP